MAAACSASPNAVSWSTATEYELDCLIFATGFEVGTDYTRRTGFEVIGRDGVTLSDTWRDGVRTLHGLYVAGFPNLFVESIAQSGFTVNFPYLLDVQATHVAWVIAWALSDGVTELEATPAAEAGVGADRDDRSAGTADRARSCTPGYYNREGQAERDDPAGQLLLRRPNRIRGHPPALARRRPPRRARHPPR